MGRRSAPGTTQSASGASGAATGRCSRWCGSTPTTAARPPPTVARLPDPGCCHQTPRVRPAPAREGGTSFQSRAAGPGRADAPAMAPREAGGGSSDPAARQKRDARGATLFPPRILPAGGSPAAQGWLGRARAARDHAPATAGPRCPSSGRRTVVRRRFVGRPDPSGPCGPDLGRFVAGKALARGAARRAGPGSQGARWATGAAAGGTFRQRVPSGLSVSRDSGGGSGTDREGRSPEASGKPAEVGGACPPTNRRQPVAHAGLPRTRAPPRGRRAVRRASGPRPASVRNAKNAP